jgi:hypothetical protein
MVDAMGLPTGQQRILDRIENALQHREPRLASMFTMFTRLNTNEGPPGTESLDSRPWWAWSRLRERRPARPGRAGPVMRTALILTLAAILTVAVVVVRLSIPRPTCTPGYGRHGRVTSLFYSNCPVFSGLRGLSHVP